MHRMIHRPRSPKGVEALPLLIRCRSFWIWRDAAANSRPLLNFLLWVDFTFDLQIRSLCGLFCIRAEIFSFRFIEISLIMHLFFFNYCPTGDEFNRLDSNKSPFDMLGGFVIQEPSLDARIVRYITCRAR